MITAWVLTSEVNEYDQYGEYFEAIWSHKPSLKQIEEYLEKENCDKSIASHILNGGGRKDVEDFWYHLKEIEFYS